MDFDHLTTFLEISKLGSFSRAGQKLFRSQPAVSAQIRQLEQEYGQKLFDRVGKTVKLTAAGEALIVYANRLLNLKEESLRAVSDLSSSPRGTLNIGANEATCLYVLPDLFAAYHRQFPAVQISIYRNFSRKVIEKIEDGTVDVGIVTLPVKSPSLKIHSIFRDRLMLMVSASNPLSRAKGVTLMKGDWTNRDPAITRALSAFGRAGVPLYVAYNAKPGSSAPLILPQLLTAGIVEAAFADLPNRELK